MSLLLLFGGSPGGGNTLHISVHAVPARGPVRARTLHISGHIVSASLRNRAHTLHVTAHTVAAGPASGRPVANTLHVSVHVVATVGSTRTINVPTITRSAVAYGPLVVRSTVTPDDLVLEVVTRAAPSTVLATLTGYYGAQFLDPHNDVGSGSFTLDNDDSDYSQIVLDRMVRFKVHGVLAFCMLIESMRRTSVSQDEEYGQNTEVSGRGHIAALEEAVMYPPRGTDTLPITDDRVFNWASPNTVYDDSAWGSATEIAQDTSTYWTGLPDGWPGAASAAWWIWASSGSQEWAPTGTCYFRRTFTVPAGVRRLRVYVGADDAMSGYLEGAKFASIDNSAQDPHQLQTFDVDVTAGDRTLAFEAKNEPDDPAEVGFHNPAGLRVAVFALDQTGVESSLLLTTDSLWKVVEYPPNPPGMTPGQVLRIVLQEAQARGALTELSWTFTDASDSKGEPWPNVTDIATKVGTDYLTFVKELMTTYVDAWMDPSGFVLNAWNVGTRGTTKSITYHTPTDPNDPTTGNLTELQQLQAI